MRLDVPASTLRFYDKEGLLPYIERRGSGYRIFSESDIQKIYSECESNTIS